MKNILVFLAIMVILIPVVIIIQNFAGWHLFSKKEYFFLVLIFIILFMLYTQGKEKKD
jgi:hypothetical protein